MSAPVRGEVREAPTGRRFYVRGPAELHGVDPDVRSYVTPHVSLIEVEGRFSGSRFAMEREVVGTWRVLSAPVPCADDPAEG